MASNYYFVGDLCLAGKNINTRDSFFISCQQWLDLTEQADLTVANLESCLIENGSKCDRSIAIPQTDCGILAESGIDVFTLSNNHTLDCGEDSLKFTQRYLHESGIETVGAGSNIEEATAPLVISKGGRNIAIIGSTDATHYKATRHRAGIAPLSLRKMKKAIRDIRNNVDLVILCIHSDQEFTNYPAPWKVRLSRQLARTGADIIIHHHPHTLQGIEIYQGTLIAYSLGNFMFPLHGKQYLENREGSVDEAAILEVNVEFTGTNNRRISYNLIPTVIDKNNNTKFADGNRKADIINKMSEYSDALCNDKKLRKTYLRLCLKQANTFIWGTYYTLCKSGMLSTYRYLSTHFSTRMHRNWMRGILTLGWL